MRITTLLFLPFVISQPCMPSIRPLPQNLLSQSIPCSDSRPLIPYPRPILKGNYLRSKIMDDKLDDKLEDDEDIEDIEWVEID